MNLALGIILSAVIGYLMGNFSAGILIAKAFGVNDIRNVGSHSSGSTNVLRTLGWVPSVLTLVGDCLKSYLAALIGSALAGIPGMMTGAFCAILGHDFPVFLKFKGGKGVASTLGMLLAMDWRVGLILLGVVLLLTWLTRCVSIGSITAAFIMPFLTAIMERGREGYALFVIFTAMTAALDIYSHRANIKRLIRGEENRLDFGKISKISSKLKIGRK